MASSLKRGLFKTLKVTGITLAVILILMFILPVIFPHAITRKITQLANQNIKGKMSFSSTNLSFFKRFPALTLTLTDFSLKGSAPFQNDTLIAAKEISFALDLASLLETKIKIRKIYLDKANINIEVDSTGHANYNVYKPKPGATTAKTDTASAALGIDQIVIEHSRLIYDDESLPMKINARDFNYSGSGNLSKDIFDLYSHTEIASVDFYYNHLPYVINKKVNADLVTSINTKSLAFLFQKNDLMINQLPVQFKGRFAFEKEGYDMDFDITSHQSDLSDIFTALPAGYAKWVDNTEINGKGLIHMALKGKYIASKNIMPDFDFDMKIKDGYIANEKTPSPITDLYLNLNARVNNLDPDSLSLNIDSLHFKIDNGFFNSKFRLKGIKTPAIYAKVNTAIDLAKWGRATGIRSLELKGKYRLNLLAEGKYATGVRKSGLRRVDTVITSFPKFTLTSSFSNGYIKFAQLPEALKNIGFSLNAKCPDNNYNHLTVNLTGLNASLINNYIKGYLNLNTEKGIGIDSKIIAKFHLDDLRKFYPIDSTDLRGDLDFVFNSKGNYLAQKKIYPVTAASVNLLNGYIKTKYYPHPIEDLQIQTTLINKTGTLAGTRVNIKPVSLKLEGQPFFVKANLKNFADLNYEIKSRGTLDIGKIYKVFAIKGYNVNGLITTNLSLKGKQSDAVAGRYNRLFNSGKMTVKDLAFRSDLFPKPFLIKTGEFTFNQDKMNFDTFRATYGKSAVVLNGWLSNVIDYAVKPDATLKGNFNLKSRLIVADDFMAFAGQPPSAKPANSTASGVILLPQNLDLTFVAAVSKVRYNGLNINNVKGQMMLNKGQLSLKQAGFTLIDAPVTMDATYLSTSPRKAYFNYHINAQNFDIQKAYRQIKLFHDMAGSASSAQGIVSLDYNLSGRLNSDMYPVYPSLKGSGVLSLQKIKLKGFKLFNAVGKQTGHDSLARTSDLSKVDIKTSIANNIITIERTKLRYAGFRPRIEGKVSFKGDMNLKFRLGLPPFGIFGIPMTITGTQQNPKIHLGNGKKEDELHEETDNGTD